MAYSGSASVDGIFANAVGHRFRLGSAQRIGLSLTTAFGHRLSKVCKQNGEPEPKCDLQIEAEMPLMSKNVLEQEQSGEYAAYFYNEHHGIPHHCGGI